MLSHLSEHSSELFGQSVASFFGHFLYLIHGIDQPRWAHFRPLRKKRSPYPQFTNCPVKQHVLRSCPHLLSSSQVQAVLVSDVPIASKDLCEWVINKWSWLFQLNERIISHVVYPFFLFCLKMLGHCITNHSQIHHLNSHTQIYL